jgi:hypothetical protein
MGTLHKIKEDEYHMEIGVMDLVGRAIALDEGWLYTETKAGTNENEKVILVKGIVKNKIIFDKRPCPNMERTEV